MTDLRFAFRAVVGGRLFTVVAIFCLALGIATNTTMFSVFDAMFLRPLPFKDASHLVSIAGRNPQTGRRVNLTLDDVRDLMATVTSVDGLGTYSGQTMTLTEGGEPERVPVQLVSATLFPLLGITPQRGHLFDVTDDTPAAAGVALISDSVWQRRYQRDESVLGRMIRLNGVPHTIVGVMPPKFRFPSTSEIWTPILPALAAPSAATRGISVVGHLAPGTSVERLNSELGGRVLPPANQRSARIGTAVPYGRSPGRASEEQIITAALMGATTALLIMACVNVANLLLARGASRRRELAVRSALGASRARLIRQLLIESLLVSLVAAAVALPIAAYGIQWVHDAVPPTEPLGPYYVDWSLDLRTFLYAIAIAVATSVGFGLAPALEAAGRRLINPLRDTSGAASSRRQRRIHGGLIVVQIALALFLLAGASLFVRTYAGQHGITLGYDTSHLMTMRVYMDQAYANKNVRGPAIDEIARRLQGLPGAYAATVTDLVPLDDQGGADSPAEVEGRTFDKGKEPTVQYAGVAGLWPETFDQQLLSGRTFNESELASATPVALVNQKLVSTFWPGQNPIGRRFRLSDEDTNPWLTVIGVVPDIRTVKLDESRGTPPTAYLPHRFISTRNWGIVIRTRAAPESVVQEAKSAVHAVDPSLALFDIYPMEHVRWLSYWMYVMWGTLFGVFGVIALVIAVIGVYGVVFYTVSQRTREIGLRNALGARRAQIVGPMLRQIAWQALFGVAIGLVGARLAAPVVASLLIGVSPTDLSGYAMVSALLWVVAIGATWLPAWRASAVDPLVALRDE